MTPNPAPVAPGYARPSHTLRLTFAFDGNKVTLARVQRVAMIAPPSVTLLPQLGLYGGFWVELRDACSAVLFHRVLHNPMRQLAEVHRLNRPVRLVTGAPGKGEFEVLVPDLPEASQIVLFGNLPETNGSLDLAKELATFPLSRAPKELPTPFAYPSAPHVRRHGPSGYQDCMAYKPFLRDEFAFRCAYCLERETWYPDRHASFSADHFEPKVLNPGREQDYGNLIYACTRCISLKPAHADVIDPMSTAMADHLRVMDDGRIEALTPEGRNLIDLLRLADSPAIDVRHETLRVLRAKREMPNDPDIHALFLMWFGYPSDLPDLTRLRPPGGNSRPDGIKNSYHARKSRGELPEYY